MLGRIVGDAVASIVPGEIVQENTERFGVVNSLFSRKGAESLI